MRILSPLPLPIGLWGQCSHVSVRRHTTGASPAQLPLMLAVRVTAWRYLERLADEGTVLRQTEYGKTGRPSTPYQWR